jgi:hypothetical protein
MTTYNVTYSITLQVTAEDTEAADYAAWDLLDQLDPEDLRDSLAIVDTEEVR